MDWLSLLIRLALSGVWDGASEPGILNTNRRRRWRGRNSTPPLPNCIRDFPDGLTALTGRTTDEPRPSPDPDFTFDRGTTNASFTSRVQYHSLGSCGSAPSEAKSIGTFSARFQPRNANCLRDVLRSFLDMNQRQLTLSNGSSVRSGFRSDR